MKYSNARHKDIAMRLSDVARRRKEVSKSNDRIADQLEVSTSTVRYYCMGLVKDGYLAEDILQEVIKELGSNNTNGKPSRVGAQDEELWKAFVEQLAAIRVPEFQTGKYEAAAQKIKEFIQLFINENI